MNSAISVSAIFTSAISKKGFAGLCSALIVALCAGPAHAADVAAKKLQIKDNATVTKRQFQVQSKDPGVTYASADDPLTKGASIHVYSATDDMCVVLPSSLAWKDTGKLWKYKDKVTKNQAQIADGKLKVKVKSGVSYSLADDGTQGHVNVQVQFGATGTRYCLRCDGNKKDDVKQFLGVNCAVAACDAEPSTCNPSATTTTTSTTTTTVVVTPGVVLQGALNATTGRFNYNLTLGLPGANAACNTNFPGTHACTYSELQAAEAAGDLDGLTDINAQAVTSFWVIDASHGGLLQCVDDALGGSGLDWEYGTAHTASRGEKVPLNNPAGTLGALNSGVQCNISGQSSVGCCL